MPTFTIRTNKQSTIQVTHEMKIPKQMSNGKTLCEASPISIGEGPPSPTPSPSTYSVEKPMEQEPRGKVILVKRLGGNGKMKYMLVSKKEGSKKKVVKTCTTKLNKFIHKQLMAGKVTGVEEALREGGSLAYFNFDGICSAAENGKIAIFQMIFEKLDYTRLIDKDLGIDLCETAAEEGHHTLVKYLRSKLENLLDKIENENLDGLDNYI